MLITRRMLITRKRKLVLIAGAIILTTILGSSYHGYLSEKPSFLRKLDHFNIAMTTNITNPPLVIVLAYMHTGSSYTGSVFQQHPGTYYHYEALLSLQSKSRNNLSVQYLNGSHRRLSGVWLQEDIAVETVNNMLNCKYNKLDISTLSDAHFGSKGILVRDQRHFTRCLSNHRRSRDISRSETIRNCLPTMVTPCLQANMRAFKFIRLPMAAVRELIRDNSNLRVIHLVRDPRAMLDSQVRKNDMGSRVLSTFTSNTKRLCDKMHSDYEIAKSFPPNIRRNIRLVRYEDITDAPLEVIETLFTFAGVRFLDQDRSYVNLTARGGNSSRLVTWRRHISQEHIDVLNKLCNQVYKEFGYIEYSDISDIRNIGKKTFLNNNTSQTH